MTGEKPASINYPTDFSDALGTPLAEEEGAAEHHVLAIVLIARAPDKAASHERRENVIGRARGTHRNTTILSSVSILQYNRLKLQHSYVGLTAAKSGWKLASVRTFWRIDNKKHTRQILKYSIVYLANDYSLSCRSQDKQTAV